MADYAIIRTGGKQYRADPGAVLTIEKIAADKGAKVEFDQVLLVRGEDVSIGEPLVANAKVVATVLEQGRDKKLLVHKYKRRKGYRKTQGHRQWITRVRIDEIIA